ncbi:hypothetical protein SBA4_610001 [Candidatus Sulfopaludibacter sp. SbA4]|nr:hypothetical protein SBA4_610001 [Candidatus Sulfopaludibacter sp. SbA4]
MSDEYWGVVSPHDLIDCRGRVTRALVLFDRIPAPDPSVWQGIANAEEMDMMALDLEFLEKHDAAFRVHVTDQAFAAWQRQYYGTEGDLKHLTTRDRFPNCRVRLFLAHQAPTVVVPDVELQAAIPVYLNPAVLKADAGVGRIAPFLRQISENILVPASGTPLADVVELRQDKRFRDAMFCFRRWQLGIVPEIMKEGSERYARAAVREFKNWIAEYNTAMRERLLNRVLMVRGVATILVLATDLHSSLNQVLMLLQAAAIVADVQRLRASDWLSLRSRPCAPAGVVYEANKVLGRSASGGSVTSPAASG